MKYFMMILFFFSSLSVFVYAQNMNQTDAVVVLAMHGGIPKDFPKKELKQFMQLHQDDHSGNDELHQKAHYLEDKLRNWPRTKENDPYYWGSLELKNAMEKQLPYPVILAFNEFCAPSIEDAIVTAVKNYNPGMVMVITPMLTSGGGHSEHDIPAAIEKSRQKIDDNDVRIEYVWPVPVERTANFLTSLISEQNDMRNKGE